MNQNVAILPARIALFVNIKPIHDGALIPSRMFFVKCCRAGTRTPILRTKTWCPTIRRPGNMRQCSTFEGKNHEADNSLRFFWYLNGRPCVALFAGMYDTIIFFSCGKIMRDIFFTNKHFVSTFCTVHIFILLRCAHIRMKDGCTLLSRSDLPLLRATGEMWWDRRRAQGDYTPCRKVFVISL